MGFINPAPPPVDIETWKTGSHLERIKPLAQDWAVNGVGVPTVVYLVYVVKLVAFCFLGVWIVSITTPGIGSVGDIGQWWTQPIVFEKLAVYTMLWEIIGLGAGSMPLTFRFTPPIGGILYWLRPGTIRLPPFPDRVLFTKGTRRTLLDVALYAAVLGLSIGLLVSSGSHVAGATGGRLSPALLALLLAALVVLGLRDKVPYLCSRPEVYGILLVVFLFPIGNLIVASQLVFLTLWIGAASSKLNRHFPFVVSVMISNTPWNPSRKAKARLYKDHPNDLRPSRQADLAAHLGTLMEFSLPVLLFVTNGGTLGTIAVVGMVLFHAHITSTFPLAVPLEWNLFMIFGILFLFGHYGAVPLSTLDNPLLLALVLVNGVAIPLIGNFRPDKVSFLSSMRYYAGNWATSQWLFRKDSGAEETADRMLTKPAALVVEQLTRFYDRDVAELLLQKGIAFRSMHSHGRALNGLVGRAVDDVEAYHVRDGELFAGAVIGWNFGDGHFHHEQLLEAVQERCQFAPGDLRVVMLESQPVGKGTQHYRIHDAATGLVEQGYVKVADMVVRQPWLDGSGTIPVELMPDTRVASPQAIRS
jgi:hypothetical protein